jgi:hypothetical protein
MAKINNKNKQINKQKKLKKQMEMVLEMDLKRNNFYNRNAILLQIKKSDR